MTRIRNEVCILSVQSKRKVYCVLGVVVCAIILLIIAVPGVVESPLAVRYVGASLNEAASERYALVDVSNRTSRAVLIQVSNLIPNEGEDIGKTRGAFHTGVLAKHSSKSFSIPVTENGIKWKIQVFCTQQRAGPLGLWDTVLRWFNTSVRGLKKRQKFEGAFSVDDIFVESESAP